ncbi:(2Fe-2S)-binding protein [Cupriavidus alkaliphilus]|uniref:(2Fe-2S)-binding protein n=1 Tax=Cupriavidus alkaliphilus TaxID=942866 RepID=UPI00161C46AB|nr:2Fe-2S iron-sulfur cluster-binding protein [Cupriavidus alkaliphilus]MBB3016837.1 xanthine dehydrogenase YagT iron-sulfur-binding subunit [Cupriavidus alkaliphilus]
MASPKHVPDARRVHDNEPDGGPTVLSRRRFMQSVGVSGMSVASGTLSGTVAAQPATPALRELAGPGVGKAGYPITLTINGTTQQLMVQANEILLDTLREKVHLTGTKKGCDHGQCGACTILVNGVSVNACLSLSVMHDRDDITTVEGLSRDGKLHPVQQAFWDHDAYQCGYCTAGQMMSAVGILQDKRIPSDPASVQEAMSGNICRCGAYKNIVAAIQDARGKMRGNA